MIVQLENARPADRDAIIALLQQGQLLTDDLPADLTDFVIAKEAGNAIGVAGLERFDRVGLLRSVVVAPHYRGQQVAANLVNQLLDNANALDDVYLITTTAHGYFQRHGFQVVDRQHVPMSIQQTRQFSDLCPSTALVMKRTLTQNQL
ncbi:hypothetical protein GCM10028818_14580 [Spirosoma horti]